MREGDVLGLPIPAESWFFYVTLGVHVLGALTALVAGILAATAGKRPGRHPRAGRAYLVGLAGVFASATVMATIRWREDAVLFAIAVVAAGLALFGWRTRRRQRSGWEYRHAIGLGGSFIALFTGFYVDNGPHLPLWRLVPHWTYWTLPATIGAPLIWLALRRFHAGVNSRRRVGAPSGS